jgi:hypothetical protein
MKARRQQCSTCIFREGNPMHLSPGRLGEIQGSLLEGNSHVCHHSPGGRKLACRGGRDYQVTIWHRLGWIDDATDEALAAAMRREGLRPPG